MFGGLGLYAEDIFFGVVDDDRLYLKVDDETRPRYQAAGTRPFSPMGSDMNGYWLVPGGIVEDVDELGEWAREAVDVARRAKRPRRAKRAKGRPSS